MNRPAVLRAILIARVSTTKSSQDTSPERQLENGRRLASSRGWQIVDAIVEKASGARVTSRPAVASALDKITRHEADVLVVDNLTRLGRNTRELLEVIDLLDAAGGAFVDVSQPMLDTTTPHGRMLYTFNAALATYYREAHRASVIDGLAHARRRGKIFGRPRTVPLDVLVLAKQYRDERPTEPYTWAEIALLVQAKTRKKYSRGALSRGVGRLEVTQ
jgi:DNA invertase Pin-like site-specific DNA recombinase